MSFFRWIIVFCAFLTLVAIPGTANAQGSPRVTLSDSRLQTRVDEAIRKMAEGAGSCNRGLWQQGYDELSAVEDALRQAYDTLKTTPIDSTLETQESRAERRARSLREADDVALVYPVLMFPACPEDDPKPDAEPERADSGGRDQRPGRSWPRLPPIELSNTSLQGRADAAVDKIRTGIDAGNRTLYDEGRQGLEQVQTEIRRAVQAFISTPLDPRVQTQESKQTQVNQLVATDFLIARYIRSLTYPEESPKQAVKQPAAKTKLPKHLPKKKPVTTAKKIAPKKKPVSKTSLGDYFEKLDRDVGGGGGGD